MEMKIFKYILTETSIQEIELPESPKFLSVQNQNDKICVWIRVNEDAKLKSFKFHIYGTGNSCNYSINFLYLGTVQINTFVWHIFVEFL